MKRECASLEHLSLANEVFLIEASEKGWLDPAIAKGLKEHLQKTEKPIRVWTILTAKNILTAEQVSEILENWVSEDLPKFQNFRLLRLLGKGSVAYVYEAEDLQLGRRVALKILHEEARENEEFVSRFRQEARAVSMLDHPNIVKIYSVGQYGELPFIAFEYVPPGETLRDWIEHKHPLPIPFVLKVGRDICLALDHAFQHRIVHRDVRPDNILIHESGVAKLTDFGLVKQLSQEEQLSLTMAGSILGDPHYIAPEQAMGDSNRDLDARSDLYSLGITLYEALTKKKPFTGSSALEVLSQHLESAPLGVSALRPDVPKAVEKIIMKMMEKSPQDRFQSPREAAEALQVLIGEENSVSISSSSSRPQYYLQGKKILYGIPPKGVKTITSIGRYFVKVSRKLLQILQENLKNIQVFGKILEELSLYIQALPTQKTPPLSQVLPILERFRLVFALTLHPTIQNMVAPNLLQDVQQKIHTYFSHLESFLEQLQVPQNIRKTKTIQVEEALPILAAFGLSPSSSASFSPEPVREEKKPKRKEEALWELEDTLKEVKRSLSPKKSPKKERKNSSEEDFLAFQEEVRQVQKQTLEEEIASLPTEEIVLPEELQQKAEKRENTESKEDSGSLLLGDALSEEEGSGSWLLGDEVSEISFSLAEAEEGQEQEISLWQTEEEEIPPVSLSKYDPSKMAEGSSFIDTKYDEWYRNLDRKPGDPLIDVRVLYGKGSQEKYLEIYVRVRSTQREQRKYDGRFIVRLEKSPDPTKKWATWWDPKNRKKYVYVVDKKSLKGASPLEIWKHHPFETPDREVVKIIRTALRNYTVE